MLDLLTTTDASPVLTEDDLRLIFEYERGPWKVEVDHYDPVGRNVDGSIYYDGEFSGNFMRHLNVDTGRIVHVSFGLKKKHQRLGFSTEYFAHCFAAYREYGFDTVIVNAGTDGKVAWAKLGFEADAEQWQMSLGEVMVRIGELRCEGSISPKEATRRRSQVRALQSGKPRMLALLDVPFDADDAGRPALAAIKSWRGTLAL